VKNVLKKTFPNITGPVNLTDAQINRGSIPSGSVMTFYQAAAPAGWSRVSGFSNTYGIRIVGSSSPGGASGGTDDPILMDKVPTHTHGFSATTGTESADHSHGFSGVTGVENQSHSHGVSDPGHAHSTPGAMGNYGDAGGGSWVMAQIGNSATGAAGTGISIGNQNANHNHNFSGGTGGRSASHTHAVSGTSAANASAANWTPRYIDMILCVRD
jgi:hypothetical protein